MLDHVKYNMPAKLVKIEMSSKRVKFFGFESFFEGIYQFLMAT